MCRRSARAARGGGDAPSAPRAIHRPGHRPSQRRAALRTAGHREDALGSSGGEQDGGHVHPCAGQRAGAEVRGRRRPHRSRTVPARAQQEGVHRRHFGTAHVQIFFDEVDSIGGTRFDGDGDSGDTDVQNTMLELVNQLDGFDARGNIKVLMATNRPDTLDPALKRPGRLDRKVEFPLPDLEGRTEIFKIHARPMTCERGIRFELLARLCPNTTGAEIRSVCTEAGMFAIRARRKAVTEDDFLKAIDKVIKGYQKFSSTSKYMVYNSSVCYKQVSLF